MAFTLNFGKGDGTGSSGFGKKASAAIDKCKSMAPYMGTLQDNLTGGVDGGAGTPGGFSGNYGSPNNMNVPGAMYSSMANQNDDKVKGKGMAGDSDADKIITEKLDNVTMYGRDKSKKRLYPSEVGGTDAKSSPSGGASYSPGDYAGKSTDQIIAERKAPTKMMGKKY